jgi:hypothetical protein
MVEKTRRHRITSFTISDHPITMADTSSSDSASNLYLHNLEGKIKLVRRQMKTKDGKPGETQVFISNTTHNPNSNILFMLGDADAGRLCRVVKKPGQFEERAESSFTMLIALEGEDARGAKLLQTSVVEGMKELGIINASISTHPDVVKLIMSPLVYERDDASIAMSVNLTDDTEYYLKVAKGKHAGKFMRITRDQVRQGDGVVVVVRCDRHREKPKHRFTRYTQKVFVIDRNKDTRNFSIVGSSGASVDIIDYDPELDNEEDEGGAGEAAGAGGAAAATGAPSRVPEEEEDEFAQALKRARNT